jgi:ribonuclease HII
VLKSYKNKRLIEAGCDEAGRGCLAGPVYAAAVILPNDFYHPLLNDSKVVTEKNRLELKDYIIEKAISWGIGRYMHYEIDEINILNASFRAMHRALDNLQTTPNKLLIDGNRFIPYKNIDFETIVKGDGKYASIAAASILAKTARDEYMQNLHESHPQYNWKSNKGYPTQEHREAIVCHGPCPYHRKSFRLYPLPEQGNLFG